MALKAKVPGSGQAPPQGFVGDLIRLLGLDKLDASSFVNPIANAPVAGMAKLFFGTGGGRAKMLQDKAKIALEVMRKGINPVQDNLRVALARDPEVASRFGPFVFQVEDELLGEAPMKMGQTVQSRMVELGKSGRLQMGYGDPIESVSRVPLEAIEHMSVDQKVVNKLKGGQATPDERAEIDRIITMVLNEAQNRGLK